MKYLNNPLKIVDARVLTNRQTDKQTNKQTNETTNILSKTIVFESNKREDSATTFENYKIGLPKAIPAKESII